MSDPQKARIRGFASLVLTRFAFVDYDEYFALTGNPCQSGDLHKTQYQLWVDSRTKYISEFAASGAARLATNSF